MFIEEMLESSRAQLVTIEADRPLMEAASKLCSGNDIVIVVGPSGQMEGLVTKTDVVRLMSVCDGASCRHVVSTAMTTDVTACTASERLQDVADRMKLAQLKNIPVVDQDGRPVAVLTIRAILRVLLHDAEYEEALLIDYVKGVGYR